MMSALLHDVVGRTANGWWLIDGDLHGMQAFSRFLDGDGVRALPVAAGCSKCWGRDGHRRLDSTNVRLASV